MIGWGSGAGIDWRAGTLGVLMWDMVLQIYFGGVAGVANLTL